MIWLFESTGFWGQTKDCQVGKNTQHFSKAILPAYAQHFSKAILPAYTTCKALNSLSSTKY